MAGAQKPAPPHGHLTLSKGPNRRDQENRRSRRFMEPLQRFEREKQEIGTRTLSAREEGSFGHAPDSRTGNRSFGQELTPDPPASRHWKLRKAHCPREYSASRTGTHRQELSEGTRKQSKAFAAKSRVEFFLEFNDVFLGRLVLLRASA